MSEYRSLLQTHPYVPSGSLRLAEGGRRTPTVQCSAVAVGRYCKLVLRYNSWYVCACILRSWLLMRTENGGMCEINCVIFQQYFCFVRKLLSLHLISEILNFEICKTDLALSVI